jgi:hypothetical protein
LNEFLKAPSCTVPGGKWRVKPTDFRKLPVLTIGEKNIRMV